MQKSNPYIDQISNQVRHFMHLETSAGILLLAAAALAMIIKNSFLSELYQAFLFIEGHIRVGRISVEKPLFLWVNDFQMAIFFFLVGLEIKREIIHGHLKDKRQLILPLAGALGGIVVPALIYIGFNYDNRAALAGWAIPTATDIAFALGVLAMVGSRLPVGLKIFLMTLAIIDDLMAIIIIALFYTSGLSTTALVSAAILLIVMVLLKRLNVTQLAPFILVGIALWFCVLKSGVHATLAGVITAFFISSQRPTPEVDSPLERMIDMLHPWVAFAILPLFAFVNAGVALEGLQFRDLLAPIPLGISLGLVIGKPVGVFVFTFVVIALGKARLPEGCTWTQLFGVSIICGIGFTMSLFIGGLAFEEAGTGYARVDRLGVLLGSLVSAVVGYLILKVSVTSGPLGK